MERILIDGKSLNVAKLVAVARDGVDVEVAPDVWPAVEASRAVVEALVAKGEVAYGITTGFGEFAHVRIEPDQVRQLQRNLITSHAVGVGEPLPPDVTRAMMLIRANTLVQGYSGIRRSTIERLIACLNADFLPVVPSRGSVGSSGDLAPLSHMALLLIGEGPCLLRGEAMDAADAYKILGWKPITLEAKEGLALINGTQMMCALGALSVADARTLWENACTIATMSLEGLMGSTTPLTEEVHALRPHPGQQEVAARMRALVAGSEIVESHAACDRVQDAYSLRCTPQVLGACKDTIERAATVVEVEMNSVTDNPLVFPDGRILSQGNFHGEPLALVLDAMALGVAEIANISERRTERLVNPDLSEGLKPFLTDRGGLNSGFMIAQYTAAALVSENKVLCHPASVDSIPTSANQEDHNSMGSIAALKLRTILVNARRVLAIEALCAAQALEGRAPLRPGKGSTQALQKVRAHVATLDEDRVLAPDVATIDALLAAGPLVASI